MKNLPTEGNLFLPLAFFPISTAHLENNPFAQERPASRRSRKARERKEGEAPPSTPKSGSGEA